MKLTEIEQICILIGLSILSYFAGYGLAAFFSY